MINLFDSLTQSKQPLKTIKDDEVSIYVCGPTAYSRPHLGNIRSVVIYDLLFRLLLKTFSRVTYVRNITDIDDKIIKESRNLNIPINKLTNKVILEFNQDIKCLNILKPTFEPRATEHIAEIIDLIKKLIKNNHAYQRDGHILFNVRSFRSYGDLSNRLLDEMISGSRVEVANYKNDPLDFVLWKPVDNSEEVAFQSPWGRGRPGWHIECSAMSCKYLGKNFDIHGGGADLRFPHHENEIAQSKCAYPNSTYAKYWVHNGFLTVNGEKMSKSLSNFVTVKSLLDKKATPMAIKYFLLSSHYRKPLDFNDKVLSDAEKSIKKLYSPLKEVFNKKSYKDGQKDTQQNVFLDRIIDMLKNDLNTPKSFSVLHQLLKEINLSDDSDKKLKLCYNLIESLDFLGLYDKQYFLLQESDLLDEKEILKKIELRKNAKDRKNWDLADSIRSELLEKNIGLKDEKNNSTTWFKLK